MLVWCMPAIVYCYKKGVCMMYSHHYVLLKMFWYDVGLSLCTTTKRCQYDVGIPLCTTTKKCTSRVYLKCLDELQEWVLPSKTREKSSYWHMSTNSFRDTVQQCVDHSPVVFYLWGNLKPLTYSATTENEDTLTNIFFMPVKPSAAVLGPLKGCYIAWSDVSMSTLIHVENIWAFEI
jgi:hypothetical protein